MPAALIATLVGVSLTALAAIVTVVLFVGRLATSLEHLAVAVAGLSTKLDSHETRISHVEGRMRGRSGDRA